MGGLDAGDIDGHSDLAGSLNIDLEWRDDDGSYKLYSEDTCNKQLVTAALKGLTKCTVVLSSSSRSSGKRNNSTGHELDFNQMTQTNVKTKWQRLIRCCVQCAKSDVASSNDSNNNTNAWIAWEWQDDGQIFMPYSVRNSLELERSFKLYEAKKQRKKVTIADKRYEVDLESMVQTNIATGFSRNIRRVVCDNEHKVHVNASEVKAEPKAEENDDVDAEEPIGVKSSRKRKKDEEEMAGQSSSGKRGKSVGGTLSSGTKKLVFSGRVPVDDECVEKKHSCQVLVEPGKSGANIWDAMLNQTNVSNNNNKYYLMQLLKEENTNHFFVWFRWGRVGYKGQNALHSFGTDLDRAKATFCQKFYDKTLNEWSERDAFEKCSGKYDIVALDYGNSPEAEGKTKKKEGEIGVKIEEVETKLDKRVFELMLKVCNIGAMESTVKELQYDLSKAPLGKLTTSQIKAGYKALDDICSLLQNKATSGAKLREACDQFYTRIPHAFGFKVPPIINSMEDVKQKLELLDALSQIEIAMSIIKSEGEEGENAVDRQYGLLSCDITPVEKEDQVFSLIEKYVANTHASSHNMYTMTVQQVFSLDKLDSAVEGRVVFDKGVGNRHLLWHGSRLSNVVGILSHGLKIAPPEAPVTGYMFGKGVYFADSSSKSANYCFPSPSNPTGFLFLCDVALGQCHQLTAADYNADKLPAGKQSVFGLGKQEPDSSEWVYLDEEYRIEQEREKAVIAVPCGKHKSRQTSDMSKLCLNYNEYVVYNRRQIKLKYLVKVDFAFEQL